MINYIDFYFEAKQKAPLTNEKKIELFFDPSATRNGKWKQVEKDFKNIIKFGPKSQFPKERISFFKEKYKIKKNDNLNKAIINYYDNNVQSEPLKIFLSDSFCQFYYDDRIPSFFIDPKLISTRQKAPYLGYFFNIEETLTQETKRLSKENLNKFIKNTYSKSTNIESGIPGVIEDLKSNGFNLPDKTKIENDKLAHDIIDGLFPYIKDSDYDWGLFLMDFVYIYTKKTNKEKLQVLYKGKSNKLEDFETNSIQDFMSKQKEGTREAQTNYSKQNIRGIKPENKELIKEKGLIAQRKEKNIDLGKIAPTQKYISELEKYKKNIKEKIKKHFAEIWTNYGDIYLDDLGNLPEKHSDFWKSLSTDMYHELKNAGLKKIEKIKDPEIKKIALKKLEEEIKIAIEDSRKVSLQVFNNTKEEINNNKKTYQKLIKNEKLHIRTILKDINNKYMNTVIDDLINNRRDLERGNIEYIIANGIKKNKSEEEVKQNIEKEIEKQTQEKIKEIKKILKTRKEWLSNPDSKEIINLIKNNLGKNIAQIDLVELISDELLISEEDFKKEIISLLEKSKTLKNKEEKKDIYTRVKEMQEESYNPIIKDILKRHIL
jgi:hypothetical protein